MGFEQLYDPANIRGMQEIVPGLFLSGSQAAQNREILNENGITHVIQVTDILTPKFPGEFIYKLITVPDLDETNLIKHFAATYKFIQEAIDNGKKVLVHCMAGASRSVTIVCAYLMKTKQISTEEAIALVRELRPIADPNNGFRAQLDLYADIEYEVDINRSEYRRFLISAMAAEREMIGYIQEMTLAADPMKAVQSGPRIAGRLPAGPLPAPPTGPLPDVRAMIDPRGSTTLGQAQSRPLPPLKCKKCRRALVSRDNVIEHMPGQGQNAFEYRKRDAVLHISEAIQSNNTTVRHGASGAGCQQYFVEPVEWIQGLQGLEGKIACPKCDSKLGAFNWSGDQCSCGAWVTPAFMMHKGKVDG
ncbi:dual specificity phosphatase 12 [Lunasporangiospora selenospora]|uniref:Dual specificity phosphatase 12 n=1 Tax=Lunasporangiospora selenospora TaxID=979761 RepID=A0A9P6KBZ8_9FUNG|nr:dual specificity phosphatase 12 [Lunasporangiospora selenospora]